MSIDDFIHSLGIGVMAAVIAIAIQGCCIEWGVF